MCCHLVITRQAQSSLEQIRANIRCLSFNIGVTPGPAIAIYSDELIHHVDRLHMHRFPDWSASTLNAAKAARISPGLLFPST